MPPSYPSSIKSFSALTDGVDQIVVAHPNERGDEIEAIETELGTNLADKTGGVAATYATVKARLDKAHRATTLVVAANDASLDSRQFADYLCDGTADDVQIQAALDALPAAGGCVLLTEGVFTLASQVLRAINNINISGSGRGTRFNLNGSTAVISAGSQAGWSLLGFDTDAGGVDVASASEFLLDYWENGARQTEGVGIHAIGGAKHTGSLAHGDLSDAPANAHHTHAAVRKTATQGVTDSTALVDCTDLLIVLAANEVWIFEACIFFEADTTPDIKFAFKVPAGATLIWGLAEDTGGGSNTPVYRARSASDDAQSIQAVGFGSAVPVHLMGTVVNGATPGNLQLRFAQAVADAGNPANVLVNSWLKGTKV